MLQFALLLGFPALELYLLVKAGGLVGALNIVLWVFASAALGIWAVRIQGQGAANRVRADLSEGRVPQQTFMEGLLLFLAGVFLIFPGLITDAVGLLLLLPFVRHAAARYAVARLAARQKAGQPGGGSSRVIFFSASSPGASGFNSPEGPAGEVFSGYRADIGQNTEPPRQAIVIESEAIEIQPEEDSSGKKDWTESS